MKSFLLLVALLFGASVSLARRKCERQRSLTHTLGADYAEGGAQKQSLASNYTRSDAAFEPQARDMIGLNDGLEIEHNLKRLWPVTYEEAVVIKEVLDAINGHNGTLDVQWTWNFTKEKWFFGLVKSVGSNASYNLAHHLLFRHGFAALLAAKMGQDFLYFLKSRRVERPDRSGLKLRAIVRADRAIAALLAYTPVVNLLDTLVKKLSLSALRNLHSFDHSWSTHNSGGKYCAFGPCILQAGFSLQAYKVMNDAAGFSEGVCRYMRDRSSLLLEEAFEGGLRLDRSFLKNALTPEHTGSIRAATTSNANGSLSIRLNRTGDYIKVAVNWDSDAVTIFDRSLSVADYDSKSDEEIINMTKAGNMYRNAVAMYESGPANLRLSEDGILKGLVSWEGGGLSVLDIPLTKRLQRKIRRTRDEARKQMLLLEAVQKWIDVMMNRHQKWFSTRSIYFYASEAADFTNMYRQFDHIRQQQKKQEQQQQQQGV